MSRFFCDWWMPDRSKCPKRGIEERADEYGAPLRFCREHAAVADARLLRDEQPLGHRLVIA